MKNIKKITGCLMISSMPLSALVWAYFDGRVVEMILTFAACFGMVGFIWLAVKLIVED